MSQLVKVVRVENKLIVSHLKTFKCSLVTNSPFMSLQDEVNQIMETNLWLRHVSHIYPLCDIITDILHEFLLMLHCVGL